METGSISLDSLGNYITEIISIHISDMRIIKNYKTKLIWGHHSHKLGLENQCSRCLVPSIHPAKGQSFTTFGGFMYSVILEASETPNPTFITWEHMQDSECQNYVSWIYGNQIKIVSGYRLPREPEVSINFLLPNEPYVCLWLCQEPFQSVMCWESVITYCQVCILWPLHEKWSVCREEPS